MTYIPNQPKNADVTLIDVTNATTTQVSADQSNLSYTGIVLSCDVTAVTGGEITVSVQGKDSASGAYYTLFTGASVTATGTTVYQVYPGSTPSTASYNGPLPTTWRVQVTAVNANVITYTCSASLIGG